MTREHLLALAEPYLLNMHALELGAGFNFTRARRALMKLKHGDRDLTYSLRQAANDEVVHAQLIQRMLYTVRYPNLTTKELVDHARLVESLFLTPWADHPSLPLIGMIFNEHLETYVVRSGLNIFTRNIKDLSDGTQIHRLAQLADAFQATVARDEKRHVEIDQAATEALRLYYPPVDISGHSIFRNPLAQFIRTRARLEKALSRHKQSASGA